MAYPHTNSVVIGGKVVNKITMQEAKAIVERVLVLRGLTNEVSVRHDNQDVVVTIHNWKPNLALRELRELATDYGFIVEVHA